MKLAIVIFGLVSTVAAQVVCRPLDTNGKLDWHIFGSWKGVTDDNELPLKNYLVTEHTTPPVRCFERLQGTFGLGNGKIVHSLWVEVKPFERWMADVSPCSLSRSKEPLYRFIKEIREEERPESAVKPEAIPAAFCQATDQ